MELVVLLMVVTILLALEALLPVAQEGFVYFSFAK